MASLVARLPAHSLRLGAAAVLAATALVGTTTSTVAAGPIAPLPSVPPVQTR